jgi:hypothetical protein
MRAVVPPVPRPRLRAWCALLLLAALGASAAPRARAGDAPVEPEDVPVRVTATFDRAVAAATGRGRLHLGFHVLEDLDRPYVVQLRLMAWRTPCANLDHEPDPPVASWRKGRDVSYDVPVRLPVEVKAGAPMGFWLGFQDPQADRVLPPRMDGPRFLQWVRVLAFEEPDFGPLPPGAGVDAVLAAAATLVKQGRGSEAWGALELGLRRAEEDVSKTRFRDALLRLVDVKPPPLSVVEREIVRQRIAAEKRRYLRLVSGRAFDRKQYHAALRILEAIGGTLAEASDAAVLGAVNDATRVRRDIADLKVRILQGASDEEKAQARKAVQANGLTRALLEKADGWVRRKLYAPASLVYRALAYGSPDHDLATRAAERRKALEKAWLADTPPEEQKVVDDALHHPVWGRTTTAVSQEFVFIGPKSLVETLPPLSKLRFDLAYVFLTNLFGRRPNPGGDRVTVYFKELWDFGGGVGGGKTIDIGRARPDQTHLRIDNGLLYHELTHCIDDTSPILKGWREGLANFGAAYAYEALGQQADALHGFQTNLKAFEDDYLHRDVAYWRMQNYGPSAGFFLWFEEKYAKHGARHDWKPYRRFFRAYRQSPLKDGRTPYVVRAAAWYLVRAFGDGAFDDLLRFRFPLRPDDREALGKEVSAFARGAWAVQGMGPTLAAYPGSPIPRDLLDGAMMTAFRRGDHAKAERISREKLGIVHAWKVIGPFKQRGADPGACVFPPQREIDFAREYPGEANVCTWRDPRPKGVVAEDSTGWVHFNFAYQDDTATYALTWLTVPEDTPAFLHVRADDDVTLWLDDRLVENYLDQGPNGSALVAWRGPYAPVPDAMKLPVTLARGRHKLLVKVRNRRGPAGFILAVARPDGTPVPGLVADTKEPPPVSPTGAGARKAARHRLAWRSVLRMSFRRKSFRSKLEPTVGAFKVVNKRLVGESTGKGVGWRKYTVRPGFPKDSPSNLIWVKAHTTADLGDLRLRARLDAGTGVPKCVVTLQGDGGTDGLSGWNVILHPAGKSAVGARIERYDHLYYQVAPTPLPAPEDGLRELEVVQHDACLTVRLGGVTLFDAVPITPIPDRHRVGLATWGPRTGLASLELDRPARP